MAAASNENLVSMFQKATDHVRQNVGSLESDKLLYLYARFKQAKEGPCNVPRPGFFDFQGKQKWDAWKQLGDLPKSDAMQEYINFLSDVDPNWENEIKEHKPGTGMGIAVSKMCHPDEDDLTDDSKTVFDWCKEGNAECVKTLLESRPDDVNQPDDEGMALLHWACDRGHVSVVQSLLDCKADINVRDSDEQTPMHYAVCCEHIPVVKLLLAHGADINIPDIDGLIPSELTEKDEIMTLLRPSG